MNSIVEAVNQIRIIDGHEHLVTQEMRKSWNTGFFGLLHYLESDLITAGMQRGVLGDKSLSIKEKATIFLKYWEKTRNTTYARILKTAVHDLYGMEDWSVEGIIELNRKVEEKSNDDDWYKTVLQKHSGIDLAFTLIQTLKVDFSLFRPIMFMDFTFNLQTIKEINIVEKESELTIHTFEQYLAAVDTIINIYSEAGMVATKLGHAYWRSLRSFKPTFDEAKQCFNRVMEIHNEDEPVSYEEMNPFQDYIIHYVIERSIACDLPIQIHTGHHETSVSGDGNNIYNSRVGDLIPLLAEHKEAKFVLLHGGIPFHDEYLSITKNFPNVYADLTWLYVISPTVAKQLLHSLIEMVPQSKILGFGGDYNFIEGTYAHQKLARKIISEVLTEKVGQGELTEEEAIELAERVLRKNLIELYQLEL